MSPTKSTTCGYTRLNLGVGTLAALYGLPAAAGIVHVDTPLPFTNQGVTGADVLWDVDGANGADFVLGDASGWSSYVFLSTVNQPGSVGLNGRGMVQAAGAGSVRDFQDVSPGLTVGSSLAGAYQFGPTAAGGGYRFLMDSASAVGASAVGFALNSDNYIGFKFDAGGTELFGWARITLEALGSAGRATIQEWAYEDTGNAIQVGDTGAAIDEPPALALLALGAGGVAAWRRRRNRVAIPS